MRRSRGLGERVTKPARSRPSSMRVAVGDITPACSASSRTPRACPGGSRPRKGARERGLEREVLGQGDRALVAGLVTGAPAAGGAEEVLPRAAEGLKVVAHTPRKLRRSTITLLLFF